MTHLPDIPERVAAGAQWLDQRKPNWFNELDLDKLNIEAAHACVLGQLYGNGSISWFGVMQNADFATSNDTAPYGFCIHDDDYTDYNASRRLYRGLQDEWKRVILERRAASRPPATKLFESGALDFCYDESFEHSAAHLAQEHGVHVKLVNTDGPGGGWPEVKLVGTLENVVKCVRAQWSTGDDPFDDEVLMSVIADGKFL